MAVATSMMLTMRPPRYRYSTIRDSAAPSWRIAKCGSCRWPRERQGVAPEAMLRTLRLERDRNADAWTVLVGDDAVLEAAA